MVRTVRSAPGDVVSGYYYSREAGAEGQILTGEGEAPGVGLDALLDRERPPLRAALAIGSALADVLCIAAEDRMIHGDIRPAHVKIDARGTVSVEGYGVQRRTTKAPEGKPESHAVDVYGLGVVLHSILSAEPLGTLPKDPDGHDDEVVSRVLAMDFRQVEGKRWLEDVRKFLCQILAWSPQDRPQPLDAANVLASVAAQCPGETLESWSQRATAAPSARPAAAAPRPRVEEEDLGGPVALAGPIAKGGVRQAPAAKGESTAFWSREKIAAMLAEEDDEDVPVRQKVSVPSRPAEPRAAAPSRPPEPPPRAAPEPPPRAPEPRATPRPERSPVEAAPARPTPSPAATPFAGARIEASSPFDEAPEKPKKSPLVWVVGVGVALALLCGVLTLGGGGMYYFMGGTAADQAAEATAAAEKAAKEAAEKAEAAKKEAEAQGAGDAGAEAGDATGGDAPKPEAGAGAKTTPTASGTSGAKTSTTTTAPKTTAPKTTAPAKTTAPKTTAPPKASAPAAPEPAATASYSVKFSTPGREAKLQCGDGQTAEFAGATTMSFSSTTTCLVRIDSGKGAVQVSKSASVTCSEDAGKVTCSGG